METIKGPKGLGIMLQDYQSKWDIKLQAVARATGIPLSKLRTWEKGIEPLEGAECKKLIAYLDKLEISDSLKLSEKALRAINNSSTRRRLMDVFGCTEFTISRYIQSNHKKLTQSTSAMKIIREVSNLPDNEILVPIL